MQPSTQAGHEVLRGHEYNTCQTPLGVNQSLLLVKGLVIWLCQGFCITLPYRAGFESLAELLDWNVGV